MDVTTSRSRTGMNAASAAASRMRAQKQKTERTDTGSDRHNNARTSRVRVPEQVKDAYEPGAASRVVQAKRAPDLQRYSEHVRNAPQRPRRA